jgi:hypothetical protein
MPDLTFNVALGREVELYNRVLNDDPVGCGLMVVVLAAGTGSFAIEDDSVLKDYETLGDVLDNNLEVTNTGYGRQVYAYTDLDPITIDHVRDRIVIALPAVTVWTLVDTGDTWAKAVVCYADDSGASSDDYGVIPITGHDLIYQGSYVVPNGTNITMDLTAGFCQAQ